VASSIARCNSDYLMWGHVKERVYAVPPRTVDDLVTRLPTDDTAVDTSTLRPLEECHSTHYLLSCNRWKPLQTPPVITSHLASFDGNMYLENLTSSICCINLATIFFFTINYTVQILCAYYSSSCQHHYGADFLVLLSWCAVLTYTHVALNVGCANMQMFWKCGHVTNFCGG